MLHATYRILLLGFGDSQNAGIMAKTSCDAIFLNISRWIISSLAQLEVKEISLNSSSSHKILSCSYTGLYMYSDILSSLPVALPHKLNLGFLQYAAFHLSDALSKSLAVCHPSPGEPTCKLTSPSQTSYVNTKNEVGSPWHFIVVWHFLLYLPQYVTYVCNWGQESFKREKLRRLGRRKRVLERE